MEIIAGMGLGIWNTLLDSIIHLVLYLFEEWEMEKKGDLDLKISFIYCIDMLHANPLSE